MIKISAVILTKNEEQNLENCLKLLTFCDEVIIIDDYSTDNTVNLASQLGAIVIKRDLNNDFAEQLNFGMSKSKNEWILFLDPDERISEELKKEILNKLDTDKVTTAYLFKRKDFFGKRWVTHGEVGAFRSIRLVKKSSGKWIRRVHQYFQTEGDISELSYPILHYPHPTMRKFLSNINQWSTLHAIANREENKKTTVLKVVTWPILHLLRNYLLRFGFLDGIEGFLYAMLMSFHSYLSWSKLYMLQKGFSKI